MLLSSRLIRWIDRCWWWWWRSCFYIICTSRLYSLPYELDRTTVPSYGVMFMAGWYSDGILLSCLQFNISVRDHSLPAQLLIRIQIIYKSFKNSLWANNPPHIYRDGGSGCSKEMMKKNGQIEKVCYWGGDSWIDIWLLIVLRELIKVPSAQLLHLPFHWSLLAQRWSALPGVPLGSLRAGDGPIHRDRTTPNHPGSTPYSRVYPMPVISLHAHETMRIPCRNWRS